MLAPRLASLLALAALAACGDSSADTDDTATSQQGSTSAGDTGAPTSSTPTTATPTTATPTTGPDDDTGEPNPTTATTQTTTTTDPEDTTTGAVDGVTYYEHVRPILARSCVNCHQPDGIAPLTLDTYDAARIFSAQIAAETEARRMPPYPADNSGACNSFRDARWLSEGDIATLAAWHAGGALAGDPDTPPPDVPPLPSLTGDVRTVPMPEPYTPNADLADDYRCFVVDNPADANGTSYITGFDVRPGDPRIVHHVVVFAPRDAKEADKAIAMDKAEAGPGYTCFGTAKVNAEIAAAWAPGGGGQRFPDNTGVAIQTGGKLVLQVHYNTLAAPGAADLTEVDLAIATEGVTPVAFVPIVDTSLQLPPGEKNAPASNTARLSDFGYKGLVTVHGVFPHMHLLGRTLDLSVDHDGSDHCMIDVPRWDFHWQLLYFYEQPGVIDADDTLTLNCNFDTTSKGEMTHWGEGTGDEMCVAGLWVSKN